MSNSNSRGAFSQAGTWIYDHWAALLPALGAGIMAVATQMLSKPSSHYAWWRLFSFGFTNGVIVHPTQILRFNRQLWDYKACHAGWRMYSLVSQLLLEHMPRPTSHKNY